MPNDNHEPQKEQTKPLLSRAFNYVTTSRPFKFAKTAFDYVQSTRAYKIVTGSAVMRGIGIVTTIAVVTVATIPAAIIGLASISIGAVMDTWQVRNLRKNRKEHNLLIKNRNAKSKQDVMLNLEPGIKSALEDSLYHPLRSGQKSLTERYKSHESEATTASSWGKSLLKRSISTSKAIITAVATRNFISIGKAAFSIYGVYAEGAKQHTKKQIRRGFKRGINEERDKGDTPGYDDLTALGEVTREQRIQTMALEKLITGGKFRKSSHAEIKTEFEAIKKNIEQSEKQVRNRRGFANRTGEFFKSFVKTHNPFSKYNKLDKIDAKTEKHSNLTKGKEAYESNSKAYPDDELRKNAQQIKKNMHRKKRSRTTDDIKKIPKTAKSAKQSGNIRG